MKFNFGCGLNKLEGYINVDKFEASQPDLLWDLEQFPWPIDTNAASHVLFNHSLEHMGQSPEVFIRIFEELYRICDAKATIQINVPHPNHDNFKDDPTHVRAITPMTLALFSKRQNEGWAKIGASNTPLAFYTGVDFETVRTEQVLEYRYEQLFNHGKITAEELDLLVIERNNVVREYRFTLTAIK